MQKCFFVALFVGLSLSAAAQAQTIDLTPGQWTVRHSVQVPAQGFTHNETSQFCLAPENASITFDQILKELNFAECSARNVVVTQSTGRADISCSYPDYGNVTAQGVMTASYGENAYRIEAQMQGVGAGTINVSYVGIGTLAGSC